MKLSVLDRNTVERAAVLIDNEGIPKNSVWSQHYFVVNNKEYPFKYLAYRALRLIGRTDIKFESNDPYRNYFENVLGFQLTYYEGGYNFFTLEELQFYNSIVGKPYRKGNALHSTYRDRLNPLIAKVNYWASQLVTNGYKLKKDSNWLTGFTANIAPYMWPRVYKEVDQDIFFNVEVNARDQFIGYKLDGYIKTVKELSKEQKTILHEFKSEIGWKWPQIKFSDVSNYDWDRLIKETKAYIQEYDSDYDHLKKRLYKEKKLARITWNTNKWVKPSGRAGKALSKSHEKDNGFGHEEWLFDGDQIIGSCKYGFLEPIHKFKAKYIGKVFDISLFTRNSSNNTQYWVTTLKNVEVIGAEEAAKTLKHYKDIGWFNQMKLDLQAVGLDGRLLNQWVKTDPTALLNIKFNASQLQDLPLELIEVDNPDDIPADHYVLYNAGDAITRKYESQNDQRFSFDKSGSTEADLKKKGKQKSYTTEREMEFRHNDLQEKLLFYLQSQYEKDDVKRECNAYGGCRIDITRKTNTGYIFYEIKTYNNLLTSIRLGIGQLLEYNLFPKAQQAEHMILVSDQVASPKIRDYILHLKSFIKLDFSYMHFDPKLCEIISII
ncbi:hypothetical protein [Mucilaginibacter phyllosphaerae]